MALAIFLLCAGFVFYAYLLFPLLLHWRARNLPPLSAEPPAEWPTLSIVIAAHNEAPNLPGKCRSLEALDYPADKVQWVIVSDGSTDNSADAVRPWFEGREDRIFHAYDTPKGKCGALNEGVALATGDVILFMDARQPVSENAAKVLVPFLDKPEFGAATGELILSDDTSLEAANFGLYWRYEKWIRDNESRLFSTTGVTGALYAIRRADFTPNPIGTLLDDFDTPIGLLKQGKRTVFVPGAYAFDAASDDIKQEFRRKVRNLGGNWQSFMRNKWLFSPSKNPVWLQFLSHKLARLLVPWALIGALLAAALGSGWFLTMAFWVQVAFYGLAVCSYLDLRFARSGVFNIAKVFVQMNAAAFVATLRYFGSRKAISWR
ncbi:MAG: glycosyltransferase family 2 protein [Pseudomonadota bacterium]